MPISNLSFPGNYYAPYGKVVVIKRSGQDSASFELLDGSYVFGRSDACDIRIQIAAVAEEHCRVFWDGTAAVLQCLSTAGIQVRAVDGSASTLGVGASRSLHHMDVITIVERSFRYELVPNMRKPDMDEDAALEGSEEGNAVALRSPWAKLQRPQRTPCKPANLGANSPLAMPPERTLLSPTALQQPAVRLTPAKTPPVASGSLASSVTSSPTPNRSTPNKAAAVAFDESPIRPEDCGARASPGRGMTSDFVVSHSPSKTPTKGATPGKAAALLSERRPESAPVTPSKATEADSVAANAPEDLLGAALAPAVAGLPKTPQGTSLSLGPDASVNSNTPGGCGTPTRAVPMGLANVRCTPSKDNDPKQQQARTPESQLEDNCHLGRQVDVRFTPQPLDLDSGIVGAALQVDFEVIASPRLSPRIKLVDPATGIHYSPLTPNTTTLTDEHRQQLLHALNNDPELIRQTLLSPGGMLSPTTVVLDAAQLPPVEDELSSPTRRGGAVAELLIQEESEVVVQRTTANLFDGRAEEDPGGQIDTTKADELPLDAIDVEARAMYVDVEACVMRVDMEACAMHIDVEACATHVDGLGDARSTEGTNEPEAAATDAPMLEAKNEQTSRGPDAEPMPTPMQVDEPAVAVFEEARAPGPCMSAMDVEECQAPMPQAIDVDALPVAGDYCAAAPAMAVEESSHGDVISQAIDADQSPAASAGHDGSLEWQEIPVEACESPSCGTLGLAVAGDEPVGPSEAIREPLEQQVQIEPPAVEELNLNDQAEAPAATTGAVCIEAEAATGQQEAVSVEEAVSISVGLTYDAAEPDVDEGAMQYGGPNPNGGPVQDELKVHDDNTGLADKSMVHDANIVPAQSEEQARLLVLPEAEEALAREDSTEVSSSAKTENGKSLAGSTTPQRSGRVHYSTTPLAATMAQSPSGPIISPIKPPNPAQGIIAPGPGASLEAATAVGSDCEDDAEVTEHPSALVQAETPLKSGTVMKTATPKVNTPVRTEALTGADTPAKNTAPLRANMSATPKADVTSATPKASAASATPKASAASATPKADVASTTPKASTTAASKSGGSSPTSRSVGMQLHGGRTAPDHAPSETGADCTETQGDEDACNEEGESVGHNLRRSSRVRTATPRAAAGTLGKRSTAKKTPAADKAGDTEEADDSSPLLRRGRSSRQAGAEESDKENATAGAASSVPRKRSTLSETESTPGPAKRMRAAANDAPSTQHVLRSAKK